ncbi:related to signal recognition particle Sec65 [Lecanosticta acicola]|uniref:Related to signal recognition particle Sec65 n=1 Tax=Lecanosticta acicola TaxID=111012 RepID=A0AAI9E9W4_9PEZI|nr:related to signal recognition particle Sec65 [Lecanosticta acicola]
MSNPRIEEVLDDDEVADDPEEMDLDAFDFARPQQGSLGQQADAITEAPSQMTPNMMQALLQGQQQHASSGQTSVPQAPRGMSAQDRERYQREQQEKSKAYQCIYPVYFDSTRSREEGRRVPKVDAVPNPLAREIVEALSQIGQKHNVPLQIVFEPTKTHPKDWANPGRVKVLVKENGTAVNAKIHNKYHLYKMISEYLKSHPTTKETPKRLQIQGVPVPKEITAPAIPRGFKIGTILPLHSPALSGGGVFENMFKDMAQMMGGQAPGGFGGEEASSTNQKKARDKRKK